MSQIDSSASSVSRELKRCVLPLEYPIGNVETELTISSLPTAPTRSAGLMVVGNPAPTRGAKEIEEPKMTRWLLSPSVRAMGTGHGCGASTSTSAVSPVLASMRAESAQFMVR